jgi:hypothetical protein
VAAISCGLAAEARVGRCLTFQMQFVGTQWKDAYP